MGLANGEGITSYPQNTDGVSEGQAKHDLKGRTFDNPLIAQVSVVTVGGTAADGDYTVTYTSPSGRVSTATFARGSGETNDQIAEKLAEAVNAAGSFRNVAKAVYTSGATFTLNFIPADKVYTGSFAQPGGATLGDATSQAAGGVEIPVGRFITNHPTVQRSGALPTNSATEADLRGFTVRAYGSLVNSGSVDADATENYKKGVQMNVGHHGHAYAKNVGGVASTRGGQVFAVIDTAGGDDYGQARADADGGNTVAIPTSRAYWAEVVEPGALGLIWLDM